MSLMRLLIKKATSVGLRVHAGRLAGDDLGLYEPEHNRIWFDLRLTPNEQCSTIAHELGHHHYGHRCRGDAKAERQADTYAARLLIEPEMYAELEMRGLCTDDIADELGITVEVVETYRSTCLQRIGDVTYAQPKMGVGQWAYRAG